MRSSYSFLPCITLGLCMCVVYGQLSPTYYSTSCPNLLSTVKSAVKQAVAKEKRMAASLTRLHFHDCFVNGCDGSVLLDDSPTLKGEKKAQPNINSARGFQVMDTIKRKVEAVCSGVVSCADILAIATRDSVVEMGGPTWTVQLGRRDSRTASLRAANSSIPPPTSNFSRLVSSFSTKGLSTKDMIVLSGCHTIGQSRCTSFRARIYNESNIDNAFSASLKSKCPKKGGDNNISPLDLETPTTFDNKYYKNLISQKGLLHSDQQLFNNGSATYLVTLYSTNQDIFFKDFAAAMVKMGNISPLTGSKGEIRKNCRKPN
ncbi:hypothetical protein SUGI_0236420 [Cryptomeria japonica]|nr:hypothetical protein SUGI_0236420 [Cryptomeria japonica]